MILLYINCFVDLYFQGHLRLGNLKHCYHRHLELAFCNGDGSRSFRILVDMAFLSKGLTRLSVLL